MFQTQIFQVMHGHDQHDTRRKGTRSKSEYGADLYIATRSKNRNSSGTSGKSNLRSKTVQQTEEQIEEPSSSRMRTVSIFRDWRNGITGKLIFSAQVKQRDEELSEKSLSHGNDKGPVRDFAVRETQSQQTTEESESAHGGETESTPSRNEQNSQLQRTRKFLRVEVEKCLNLKASLSKITGLNPLILIRLDGTEIGRTPALKNTTSPIWHDELYEFPICSGCKYLSFEVWDAASPTASSQADWDFIGKGTIDVSNLLPELEANGDKYQTFTISLKKWRNMEIDKSGDQPSSCCCPHSTRGDNDAKFHARNAEARGRINNRSKTIRIKRPTGIAQSFRKNRLDSITITKPNEVARAPGLFRVENSDPFRRSDIREFKESSGNDSFYRSTSFRALSLIVIYMSVGVLGFSFLFEKWELRDSIYFSVVTFTTVGYGDIRPATRGGKLFSCFFAFMGIGIIGIALGYVGQNLIQAQVIALQKRPQSEELEHADDDEALKPGTKDDMIESTRPSLEFKGIFMFFLPLTAMVTIGSVVVGHIEKWSWVDSFYWCVMTGTSVGYGDYYPETSETIWFCVFFIPISVGVISAALGRIANIFVEREIRKANIKLLHREVTLEDLEAMNADGDGEVSPLEFVEHMLLVMNKVDQQLLDELHAQFHRLDADGSGGLQQDDLEILTERKLKEFRSRALKQYEDNFLHQKLPSNKRIVPYG